LSGQEAVQFMWNENNPHDLRIMTSRGTYSLF
jgi:hypothetical protein